MAGEMKIKLSRQELILGALSTAIFIPKLGWLGLILCTFTGVLWALGGSWRKSIRRFGIPFVVASFANNLWALLGVFPLLLGDGYPSTQPADAGSWLGRQVKKLGLSDYWGGLVTKVIPVLLLQGVWWLCL